MVFEWTITGALFLGSAVLLYVRQRALSRQASHSLPPGPPGLPWIGTVSGIDASSPWITYAEWAKKYGDLIYSRLLGKDIIVVNSEKIAKDLLENRAKNYSDRPHFIVLDKCGLGTNTVFLPYGDRWRLHRRFFHQTFRADAVHRFLPAQHRKVCLLLRRLLDAPDRLDDHVFEYTAAVIMNSTYDYDPASRKDELVDVMAHSLHITVPIVRPDISVTVEAFPGLLYLPSWFPGMSFKRDMETARDLVKEYVQRPFDHVLQKLTSGQCVAPSMVHDALRAMEEKETLPEESCMDRLKEAAGSAFAAASETTRGVLMTFFLMMVLNQEAQEKAQAQIDTVVGKDRLPSMDDRPLLPFVDAIFRETLRYQPVAPLALPHAVAEDDIYEGFHIPKGAILLVNLWAMTHDESRFPNPHAFLPERFLNVDGSLKPNDIEHLAFGFGHRICVGRYFADTSVWSVMAKVLAAFKILRALDENGSEIPVQPLFSSGNAVRPLPFRFRIVPRFTGMNADQLEELIAGSTP